MARKPFSATSIANALPQAPEKPAGACTAYGCPLAGTIYNTTGGDGWCWMHARHAEKDIPKITQGIRARASLFIAAREISRMSQVKWWQGEFPLDQIGAFRDWPELRPTPEEKNGLVTRWCARVFRDLEEEILNEAGYPVPKRQTHVLGAVAKPLTLSKEDRAAWIAAEAHIAEIERQKREAFGPKGKVADAPTA